MKNRKAFFLHIFIYLLGSIFSIYGKDKDDLCNWIIAELLIKHNKWSYLGIIEERINNNISSSQLFSAGMHVRYQLTPSIRLSGAYEFFGNTLDGKVTPEHRLMVQGEYSLPVNNWKLTNRFSILNDFEDRQVYEWQLRDRIHISYQLKRVSPFTYIEVYTLINDFDPKLYKIRYAAGTSITLNNKNNLSIYYMLEDYDTKPLHQHVIGLTYTYSINL